MTSFYSWIRKFSNDDSQIGEISSNIINDECFPKKSNILEDILTHVKNHCANDEYVLNLVKESFAQYLSEVKKTEA